MKIISEKNEFMSGIYVIEFNTKNEAKKFIDIYSNCPIWPIVTKGRRENEVFLFAIELKRQKHGDFLEEHNTLVKNPNYIGAKEVTFKRDDTLIGIFKNYKLKTSYSNTIPCGSNCEKCNSFKNPCKGCPAYYKY